MRELESSHPPPSGLPTDDLLGLGLGDPSDTTTGRLESHKHHRTGLRYRLRSTLLPYYNGEDATDNGVFDGWAKKLQRCAKVDSWNDQKKLLQFEL